MVNTFLLGLLALNTIANLLFILIEKCHVVQM